MAYICRSKFAIVALSLCLVVSLAGCLTSSGQKGALGGAGIGALAGQIIGGNTTSTLIGTGVGLGLGYIIGNEMDKKQVVDINQERPESSYGHNEVAPLGGSRWRVLSINPASAVPPFKTKVIEFKSNGIMVTETTNPDGTVDVDNEHFRVVGNTLIMNGHGYLVNARYGIEGNQLVVDSENMNLVMEKL